MQWRRYWVAILDLVAVVGWAKGIFAEEWFKGVASNYENDGIENLAVYGAFRSKIRPALQGTKNSVIKFYLLNKLQWKLDLTKGLARWPHWLVHPSSDRAVPVPALTALAGDIALCSWTRPLTLTVLLSTP